MTPIPGEPLDSKRQELVTGDGRKVKLKIPGLAKRPEPEKSEERGAKEPPREDPRPPVNPNVAGF